jgi:hypothetical protein
MLLIQKFIMEKLLEISYAEGQEESIFWGKGSCVELFWNRVLLF